MFTRKQCAFLIFSLTLTFIQNAFSASRLDSLILYEWVNETWQKGSRTTFTYDRAGRKTESLTEDTMNGEWVYSSKKTFFYSNDTLKDSSAWSEYKDGKWITLYTNRFVKQSNKIVRHFVNVYNGDTVSVKVRFDFEYDGERCTTEQNYIWKNDQWIKYSIIRNTFTGNHIDTSYHFNEDGVWVLVERRTHKYDANGFKVESKWEELDHNKSWLPTDLYIYVNDTDGNTIEETWKEWNNGEWEYKVKAVYKHVPISVKHYSKNIVKRFGKQEHIGYEFFDLSGRKVFMKKNSGNNITIMAGPDRIETIYINVR